MDVKACEHRYGAKFGCDACAQDVRGKLPQFPLQTTRGSHGPPTIPWVVAERAWAAYSALYGRDQSVERLAERGGFSWGEMDDLFPAWREMTNEWNVLREENARLRARIAELEAQCRT